MNSRWMKLSSKSGGFRILFLGFLSCSSSCLFGVSLKVTRPTPTEGVALPVGFTYVIGVVNPAASTVTCNGVSCDVDEDGAFIGFAPIRFLKEPVLENGKTCDASFEFVARHDTEEKIVSIPIFSARSPSAAVAAQEVFDAPKKIRIIKDQWIGLEDSRLGEILYIQKGSHLSARTGGRESYYCEVGDTMEFSVPTSEVEVVVQADVENVFRGFLFSPQNDTKIKIMDLANSSVVPFNRLNPWGFEALITPIDSQFIPRSGPAGNEAKKSVLHGIRVCLDPGHHPDPGAIGPRGFEERESNLLLSREIARLLELEGATVSFTREQNALPLKERHARMRELKPDLVVSVHNNSVGDGQDPRLKHGTQTFYLHPWSKALAESVHQAILTELGTKDLGCIRRNLYITRFMDCPSILIEPEYLILPGQEKKFMNAEYRSRLAKAVLIGIQEFVLKQALIGKESEVKSD